MKVEKIIYDAEGNEKKEGRKLKKNRGKWQLKRWKK